MRWNATSPMRTATRVPRTAPTAAGGTESRSHAVVVRRRRWKLREAPAFWIRIATRFVPFATVAGRPRKIITGSVSMEPPRRRR